MCTNCWMYNYTLKKDYILLDDAYNIAKNLKDFTTVLLSNLKTSWALIMMIK